MTFIDIQSPDCTAQFMESPIYLKVSTVQAELVTVEQKVTTIVDGDFFETEDIAAVGSYIITNPDGERYILPDKKFNARYTLIEGNTYQASGIIRAFRNNTGGKVEILAQWGSPQYGQEDCYFAITLEANGEPILNDRYIIEATAFANTYIPKL